MTQNDRIIVIASDGVWEFLENDDIMSKLVPYYESNKIEEACDFLL
jgi:serine/threonine protein phosphatase PrpC